MGKKEEQSVSLIIMLNIEVMMISRHLKKDAQHFNVSGTKMIVIDQFTETLGNLKFYVPTIITEDTTTKVVGTTTTTPITTTTTTT